MVALRSRAAHDVPLHPRSWTPTDPSPLDVEPVASVNFEACRSGPLQASEGGCYRRCNSQDHRTAAQRPRSGLATASYAGLNRDTRGFRGSGGYEVGGKTAVLPPAARQDHGPRTRVRQSCMPVPRSAGGALRRRCSRGGCGRRGWGR